MVLRAWRALSATALCVTVGLTTTAAHGAPLTAAIAVERDESASDCPDQAALTREVERILQRSFSTTGTASDEVLQVAVHFTADHGVYSAEVRSLGPKRGERRLQDHGRSCAALAEAVSVAIALLLDKELERRNAEPALATAPLKNEPRSEPLADEQAPHSELRSWFELRALFEGGITTGLSGSRAPLLSEALGVRVQKRLWLEAGFNAALPATTDYDAGRVRTTLLFASLRACYAFNERERYSFGPCALLGFGRLRGVGLGYASVQSESLPWVALGAGLVAEGPVWGRVFWGLSGTLWVPTRRSTFSVENAGIAWQSSPVGASASVRLGFRIW